jgi:hypothetical protein
MWFSVYIPVGWPMHSVCPTYLDLILQKTTFRRCEQDECIWIQSAVAGSAGDDENSSPGMCFLSEWNYKDFYLRMRQAREPNNSLNTSTWRNHSSG